MSNDASATDREVGAALLRRLRESRGWSWPELARALRDAGRQLQISSFLDRKVSNIQRSVARWESRADSARPGERYQFLLAYIYAQTPSGDVAFGQGSDLDALLDAFRHLGVPESRLRELSELIAQSLTPQARDLVNRLPSPVDAGIKSMLLAGSPIDDGAIQYLNEVIDDVNSQVGSLPFGRLQLSLAPVTETCRRLLDGDVQHEGVLMVAAKTYSLAARLAFETRDDVMATSLYERAASVAGRLRDHSHLAMVRTSQAMVSLHTIGGFRNPAPPEAAPILELTRAATVAAHRGPSYAARARAHAVHAEVCARTGRSDESSTSLERAWKTVDQLAIDDPYGQFNSDRLNGFEGLCALYAGGAERAHDRLTRSAAALHGQRDAVQRGIVSSDLAMARLRLDDPAACVELMHEAVDIAAATGGRVPALRIKLARRQLRPWRATPFVADLDDHIHEALLG